MKKSYFALLVLTSLLTAAGSVPAQADEQTCVVLLSGQNRYRKMAGRINVECGFEGHTVPWGNWGVDSNYGGITDTDQFRGWQHEDGPPTKLQWNSCTTGKIPYWAPNCRYYNADNCTTQKSNATVTHGRLVYRSLVEICTSSDEPGTTPETYYGCQAQGGPLSQTSNYMDLYELDWDGNDFVETLEFPGTSVTLTGCDYYGCPEKITAWVDMTDDTSSSAHVEAQLRMRARAYLEGFCDWNWEPPQPVIDSFTADPTTITAGGSTTLEWETTNATSVRISDVSESLPENGSETVSPTETTTYTLTALGAGINTLPVTDAVTVTVTPAGPVIDSFEATSTTITAGTEVTLTWTTTNATSVSIPGTSGTLAVDGSTTVSPTTTTTYTLTASGASGTTAATATVTVTVNPPDPVIDTFTASSTSITAGTQVTLTWTTTNATSVSIPGTSGTLAVDGSTTVSPTTPTTYTLTANGASGTTAATATVTITITISGQPTATLTANPAAITSGQSATLTWATSDATSASID